MPGTNLFAEKQLVDIIYVKATDPGDIGPGQLWLDTTANSLKVRNLASDDWLASGVSSPGGSTTQVQFNDAGVFGGDAGLTYVKATDTLNAGVLAAADGTSGAPSISLQNLTTAGFYKSGGNLGISSPASIVIGVGSGSTFRISGSGGQIDLIASTSQIQLGSNSDGIIIWDAAQNLAFRNGTNSQKVSFYDTFASTTDFHRLAIKTARASVTAASGATVTATSLIPAGAVVVGVTTKVTTGLGGSVTGYTVGDGTDADRWGSVTGTIAGTSTDNRDWTATTVQAFIVATSVVLTALTANFNGTGVIYVSVQYLIGEVD